MNEDERKAFEAAWTKFGMTLTRADAQGLWRAATKAQKAKDLAEEKGERYEVIRSNSSGRED